MKIEKIFLLKSVLLSYISTLHLDKSEYFYYSKVYILTEHNNYY